MTKLNPTQRALLQTAVADLDGRIDETGVAERTASRLIRLGLAISIPKDAAGRTLLITAAGKAAAANTDPGSSSTDLDLPQPSPEAPTGKLGLLIALLRRPEGARIEELTAATGWQAHSVRGAMSGALKKARGFAVLSEKTDGGRVYRITAAPTP